MYRTLLESYQQLQQEMASVAADWQECEKRIDDYVDEQVRAPGYLIGENDSTMRFPLMKCSNRRAWRVSFVLQLLFKVEGQSLSNQRTEPHKSLISKNVRRHASGLFNLSPRCSGS